MEMSTCDDLKEASVLLPEVTTFVRSGFRASWVKYLASRGLIGGDTAPWLLMVAIQGDGNTDAGRRSKTYVGGRQ